MEEFRQRLDAAQTALVGETLSVVIDMMYDHCKQRYGADIVFEDPALHGKSQEEFRDYMKSLAQANEFKAARTFNKIAQANGVDISLKTSGAKSVGRMDKKAQGLSGTTYAWGSEEHIKNLSYATDQVRLTVVSSHVDVLDECCNRVRSKLDAMRSPDHPCETLEDWFMRPRAILSKVLKSGIGEINAEVQFLPRQQARCGARITYKYSTFARLFDEAMASDGDTLAAEDIKAFNKAIAEYNEVAKAINELIADAPIDASMYARMNELLATDQQSTQTYDTGTEGGAEPKKKSPKWDKPFTPIFKKPQQLFEYASFLKENMPKIGIDAMPVITPLNEAESMDKAEANTHISDIKGAIKGLAQLTHICYMRSAKEPMRDLFVSKAMELNNTQGRYTIPKEALETLESNVSLELTGKGQGVERG